MCIYIYIYCKVSNHEHAGGHARSDGDESQSFFVRNVDNKVVGRIMPTIIRKSPTIWSPLRPQKWNSILISKIKLRDAGKCCDQNSKVVATYEARGPSGRMIETPAIKHVA